MEGAAPSPIGLREFKKARTRQAISDVATRLFIQRGFDHVTVQEVAAAAEVSVKTVFNYFASKEELFFDRADEVVGALIEAVLARPEGVTVVEALHALLADRYLPFAADGWKALRDPERYEAYRSFLEAENAAAALRGRRLIIGESWIPRLAGALAHAQGRPDDDPGALVLAAMVVAVLGLRERAMSAAMLERASARQVERRVRAVVDEAFARLAAAFPDGDERPPPAQ
jgi:AcrR family transcriptional regulator